MNEDAPRAGAEDAPRRRIADVGAAGERPFGGRTRLGDHVLEQLQPPIMSQAEMTHFHETKTRYHLGDGETEALVIALGRGWRVATDDGSARKRFGGTTRRSR